jgi:hypothetical protein
MKSSAHIAGANVNAATLNATPIRIWRAFSCRRMMLLIEGEQRKRRFFQYPYAVSP